MSVTSPSSSLYEMVNDVAVSENVLSIYKKAQQIFVVSRDGCTLERRRLYVQLAAELKDMRLSDLSNVHLTMTMPSGMAC